MKVVMNSFGTEKARKPTVQGHNQQKQKKVIKNKATTMSAFKQGKAFMGVVDDGAKN